jgi:hypothetical protein
VSAAYK